MWFPTCAAPFHSPAFKSWILTLACYSFLSSCLTLPHQHLTFLTSAFNTSCDKRSPSALCGQLCELQLWQCAHTAHVLMRFSPSVRLQKLWYCLTRQQRHVRQLVSVQELQGCQAHRNTHIGTHAHIWSGLVFASLLVCADQCFQTPCRPSHIVTLISLRSMRCSIVLEEFCNTIYAVLYYSAVPCPSHTIITFNFLSNHLCLTLLYVLIIVSLFRTSFLSFDTRAI